MAYDGRDHRREAEDLVSNALQVMIDADGREYTRDELDKVVGSMTMALVQIKRIPGGVEAYERTYEKAREELRRRGREDMIREVEPHREAAIDLVKKTFGDDVDLRPGTAGHAFVRVIEAERADHDKLRSALSRLMNEL